MNLNDIKFLLKEYKDNKLTEDEILGKLKNLPYHDLDIAKLDYHRNIRKGFPEVVLCEGKQIEHIQTIVREYEKNSRTIMLTRATKEVFEEVKKVSNCSVEYYDLARIILIGEIVKKDNDKNILILTGGTADIPVAEEAYHTARIMGNKVDKVYDVGVAGIHRLLSHIDKIQNAKAIIAVAGMEGALASVVAGLAPCPVIAVPTSVGYGTHLNGLAALLSMLNSCSPGIATMNIDNGFGAGYYASLIVNN